MTTVRTVDDLPCASCTDPRGAEIRHALAQTGNLVDELQLSPHSRLPVGCCRIRSMPVVTEAKVGGIGRGR